jgi:hypothetical protein
MKVFARVPLLFIEVGAVIADTARNAMAPASQVADSVVSHFTYRRAFE